MAKIISIVNQKGGVGKTTTAINLAAALAATGYKILIIDMDPQGNATTGLGIDKNNCRAHVYDALVSEDTDIKSCIVDTIIPNLYLMPANSHLASLEKTLLNAQDGKLRLKKALSTLKNYDLIFIDCPPSLSALNINALVASNYILIPVQCEFYALEGLGSLLDTIARIRHNINPSLAIAGIVMTMFDGRNGLSHAIVDEVKSTIPEMILIQLFHET